MARMYGSKAYSDQYDGKSRFASATISEIIDHGDENRPWLARAYSRSGREMLVASITPFDADVGDDIHANGVWTKPMDNTDMPPRFVVDEPDPTFNRLKDMTDGGANIKGFGTSNPDDTPSLRPGLIAQLGNKAGAMLGKAKDKAAQVAKDKLPAPMVAAFTFEDKDQPMTHFTVTKRPEIKDPDVKWMDGLARQVPGMTEPVTMVDPRGFTPESASGEFFERTMLRFPGLADNMRADMGKHLPQQVQDMMHPGLHANTVYANPALMGASGGGHPGVVISHNPYTSSHGMVSGLAGVDPAIHGLKQTPGPQMMKQFVMAHEFAHSVQHNYRDGPSADITKTHGGENFADSFAVMAVAQKNGSTEGLGAIRNARSTAPLSGIYTHATGRSFDAAMEQAQDWIDEGVMKDKTADDFLRAAAKISNENALSPKQQEMIFKIDRDHKDMPMDQRADMAMAGQGPFNDPLFQEAAMGYRDGFHSPRQLMESRDLQHQVVQDYAKDVSASVKSSCQHRGHAARFKALEGSMGGASGVSHMSSMDGKQFSLGRTLSAGRHKAMHQALKSTPLPEKQAMPNAGVSTIGRPGTMGSMQELMEQPVDSRINQFVYALNSEYEAANGFAKDPNNQELMDSARSHRSERVQLARSIVLSEGGPEALEKSGSFVRSAVSISANRSYSLEPETSGHGLSQMEGMVKAVNSSYMKDTGKLELPSFKKD